MAFILIIVGALQILGAAAAMVSAKSNIHEIYSAILFTGGMLEIAVAAMLMKMTEALEISRKIERQLAAPE